MIFGVPNGSIAIRVVCPDDSILAIEKGEKFCIAFGLADAFDHRFGGVFNFLSSECASKECALRVLFRKAVILLYVPEALRFIAGHSLNSAAFRSSTISYSQSL